MMREMPFLFACAFLFCKMDACELSEETIQAFSSYLTSSYLDECRKCFEPAMNEDNALDDEEEINDIIEQIIILKQSRALLMLSEREKGIVTSIGNFSLATIAASCGKYQWMRECIETGDADIPAKGEFESPFIMVVSGLGNYRAKEELKNRINEAEWIISRHEDFFSHVEVDMVYLAAQASGLYANDKGEMFDYLIGKGMPVSHEAIRLLLTIDDSCWVIEKRGLFDHLSMEEIKDYTQFLLNASVSDKTEKIELMQKNHRNLRDFI